MPFKNFLTLNKNPDISTKELKEEINMILNNTPEDIPESILDHLKNLLSSWGINVIHTHNLNKILREDKEVLEKPAR